MLSHFSLSEDVPLSRVWRMTFICFLKLHKLRIMNQDTATKSRSCFDCTDTLSYNSIIQIIRAQS